MVVEHPELAALLLEELIAFAFAGMALVFIVILMVLLRRENHGSQSAGHRTDSLSSLQARGIDILEIYDDVVVIPPPRSRHPRSGAKPHLVRRTAKVRERRSGHIYLTRLTVPSEEVF